MCSFFQCSWGKPGPGLQASFAKILSVNSIIWTFPPSSSKSSFWTGLQSWDLAPLELKPGSEWRFSCWERTGAQSTRGHWLLGSIFSISIKHKSSVFPLAKAKASPPSSGLLFRVAVRLVTFRGNRHGWFVTSLPCCSPCTWPASQYWAVKAKLIDWNFAVWIPAKLQALG